MLDRIIRIRPHQARCTFRISFDRSMGMRSHQKRIKPNPGRLWHKLQESHQ